MLINYTEFKNKWNGKYCEAGGSPNAQFQCVDIVNQYIKEVLGFPIVLGTNAVDFPKKCLAPNYEYIKNSTTAVPVQGDIIIWSSPDGIGHIGICDGATVDKFTSFDQNWPVGSVCKLVNHTYTGTYKVIGWLRGIIKELPVEDNMTEEQKKILAFIGERTEGQVREAFGALSDLPNLIKEMADLKSSYKSMEERVGQLEADAKANNDLIADYQTQLMSAKSTESKLQAEVKAMSDEKNVWKNRYEAKLEDIKKLDSMTAWEHIKYGITLLIQKSNK